MNLLQNFKIYSLTVKKLNKISSIPTIFFLNQNSKNLIHTYTESTILNNFEKFNSFQNLKFKN